MKIDNLDEFRRELIQQPLLSEEEELSLLKTVQEKGADCDEMDKLFKATMKFVYTLAAQYKDRGLTIEKLIKVEAEGLKKAILTYDFDSDIEFKKHAVSLMRQYLEEAIKEQIHK